MLILWLKAFHIIFLVCWFAGIFYLPRLFVNHAMTDNLESRKLLLLMEKKLYRFITPFAYLTIIFGLILTYLNLEYYISQIWFWIKLLLVVMLVLYHIQCGRFIKKFESEANKKSHIYYRWFNEIPVVALFGIVILVVIKPFSS